MLRMSVLSVAAASLLAGAVFATEPTTEPVAKTAPAAGAITGTVRFKGEAPKAPAVELDSDPVCVGMHPDGLDLNTVRTTASGGLADVFAWIDNAPDERFKAPKEPVVLDQTGCNYEPHVFGMIKKQDIKILNSDATLHNIHAVPKDNKEFNVGMPEGTPPITKTFKKDELAIRIKCDVHPWMVSYAFSMEHPFFGVSGADGKLMINTEGLPDGDYGVKLWHETLGEASTRVTVAEGVATFEHEFTR
ncbi:MAG: methylamine utilization protein [Planctomycetota bacterium]|nr:MAG: methylamine utilization protein [Planctomycetota bacterium]